MSESVAFLPGELLHVVRRSVFWSDPDQINDLGTFVSQGSVMVFVKTMDEFSLVLVDGRLGFVRTRQLLRMP